MTRTDLADVERYARGEFLADLVKGQADTEATTRLADKVAALTGIDQAVSRRLAGRFDVGEFRREFDRQNGKVTGRYDASVSGFDPYPDSSDYHFGDPSGDSLMAPLTSAAVDLTTRKLNWRPDGSYQLLSESVDRSWDFGRGPAESVSQLRQILALDPKMKLLVGPRAVRSRHALFRVQGRCSTSCRPLPVRTGSSSSSIPAATCSIRATARVRRSARKSRR